MCVYLCQCAMSCTIYVYMKYINTVYCLYVRLRVQRNKHGHMKSNQEGEKKSNRKERRKKK